MITAQPDQKQTSTQIHCFHCGEPCKETTIHLEEKAFCCEGCKLVYEILNENNLCNYYDVTQSSGNSPDSSVYLGKFNYLTQPEILQQLLHFNALFITGLLNGLLPCGLIYIALAGATSSGETIKGALFMAVFGLGTLPAMFSVSFISSISKRFRSYLSHTAPVLTFIMGTLLVVRGLGLGIPYLSPVFKAPTKDAPAVIYCHKPQQLLTPASNER